jgi:hypothetical protein
MAHELVRVGRLSLIKSRPHHAEEIADSLRFYDKRECMIWGFTPLEALTEPFAVDGSRTYTIKFDDNPIAMCGAVPIDEHQGRVWMLGTGGVNNNFRPFLRGCREVIKILQGDFHTIENFVPVDHHETIMWLSWCGFTFDEETYEINGHAMMRFVRCSVRQNNVYYLNQRPVMH